LTDELGRAQWRRRGHTIKAASRRRYEFSRGQLDDELVYTNRALGAGAGEHNHVTISGWAGSEN
jgi:hypothetical protein